MSVVKRISNLEPYIPSKRSFDSKNWSYCDWNESQFPPSPKVKESIQNFLLDDNLQKYPCNNNDKLISLLCNYTNLSNKNITIYNGSDDALKDIFFSFADQDTRVITYTPSYTQVDTFITLSTDKHHKEEIIDPMGKHIYNFKIFKDYDIVYLVNPNNPTGHIIKKDIIEKVISNPKTLFIIDEAYYEFSKHSCCELVLKYDNIMITRTFSKAFGLASLRIGYVLAPKTKIEFLNKVRNVKSVNAVAQNAAIACLQDLEYLEKCVSETKKSRKLLEDYINNSKYLSCNKSHSNFILVKTNDAQKVIKKMIDNNISIRDRSSFKNLDNCIRITVGSLPVAQKIIEVLENIE